MDKQRQMLFQIFYYAILAILSYLFLRYVLWWLLPFFTALISASIIHHLAKKLPHLLSLALTRCLLLLILVLIFILFTCISGFKLFDTLLQLCLSFPRFYETIYLEQAKHINELMHSSITKFSLPVQNLLRFILIQCSETLNRLFFFSSFALLLITQLAAIFPKLLVNLFLTLLFTLFLCLDFEGYALFYKKHLPSSLQSQISLLQSKLYLILRHYVQTAMQIMFCTFLCLWLGFRLLKLENSLLASLIAFADLLPAVGTSLILLPWSLAAFLLGYHKLAGGLIVQVVVISLLHQLLEPRLLGKKFNIPPLIFILGMIMANRLFGFFGFLVSPFILILLFKKDEN